MSSTRWLFVFAAAIGALYGFTAPTAWAVVPIAKLTLDHPVSNEYLGYSVATDGQRVFLGTGVGTAYLFDPFTKQLLAKVTLPRPLFGTSVAFESNTGVVGNGRHAFMYDFSNLSAPSSMELVPSDVLTRFGISVDMSGNTIIVGGSGAPILGVLTGAAYLFNRETGAQFAKLSAADAVPGTSFGINVAVDGDLAVVGSTSPGFGAAYLYNAAPEFSGSRQLNKFTVAPTYSDRGTNFGYNVDISGTTIVAADDRGSYLWSTTEAPAALPFSNNFLPSPDQSSIAGDYVAIGHQNEGFVDFYDKSGVFLKQLVSPSDSPIGFGDAVAIGGGLVVVSAPGGAPQLSAVYVYRLQDILVPEPSAIALFLMGCPTAFRRRR